MRCVRCDGALRLVVINKDVRAISARIEPGRRFAKGGVSMPKCGARNVAA
jgi:hypothetical protein